MTLREAKQAIREYIGNWSDQKLAEVYAFNQDGRMKFMSSCQCIIGVSTSGTLHKWEDCTVDGSHYRGDISICALMAEKGYWRIGLSSPRKGLKTNTDDLRRIRFSPILRAEMHRRARVARPVEHRELVAV